VAGRRAGAGLALAAVALSAASCGIGGSTKTVTTRVIRTRTITVTRTVTAPATAVLACSGAQLAGTFNESPGGGGAGQIQYDLTLTNTSSTACTLQIRTVVLLNASGSRLPTKTFGALPAGLLAPNASTSAPARFSPDVPGTGDSQSGACQPKAYTLRVAPTGSGTVDASIKPPTSVCERGTLTFPSN
jgi:Protein of unknown function (DUF4232)